MCWVDKVVVHSEGAEETPKLDSFSQARGQGPESMALWWRIPPSTNPRARTPWNHKKRVKMSSPRLLHSIYLGQGRILPVLHLDHEDSELY